MFREGRAGARLRLGAARFATSSLDGSLGVRVAAGGWRAEDRRRPDVPLVPILLWMDRLDSRRGLSCSSRFAHVNQCV